MTAFQHNLVQPHMKVLTVPAYLSAHICVVLFLLRCGRVAVEVAGGWSVGWSGFHGALWLANAQLC